MGGPFRLGEQCINKTPIEYVSRDEGCTLSSAKESLVFFRADSGGEVAFFFSDGEDFLFLEDFSDFDRVGAPTSSSVLIETAASMRVVQISSIISIKYCLFL